MHNPSTILTTSVSFVLIVSSVMGLLASPSAQGDAPNGRRVESAFACNRLALTPAERKRHFEELGPQLRALKKSVRELPNGYAIEFPADSSTVLRMAEWASGERACCPFFDIDMRLEREGGSLWLSLTGREGVKQFIQADGASWIKQ